MSLATLLSTCVLASGILGTFSELNHVTILSSFPPDSSYIKLFAINLFTRCLLCLNFFFRSSPSFLPFVPSYTHSFSLSFLPPLFFRAISLSVHSFLFSHPVLASLYSASRFLSSLSASVGSEHSILALSLLFLLRSPRDLLLFRP